MPPPSPGGLCGRDLTHPVGLREERGRGGPLVLRLAPVFGPFSGWGQGCREQTAGWCWSGPQKAYVRSWLVQCWEAEGAETPLVTLLGPSGDLGSADDGRPQGLCAV